VTGETGCTLRAGRTRAFNPDLDVRADDPDQGRQARAAGERALTGPQLEGRRWAGRLHRKRAPPFSAMEFNAELPHAVVAEDPNCRGAPGHGAPWRGFSQTMVHRVGDHRVRAEDAKGGADGEARHEPAAQCDARLRVRQPKAAYSTFPLMTSSSVPSRSTIQASRLSGQCALRSPSSSGGSDDHNTHRRAVHVHRHRLAAKPSLLAHHGVSSIGTYTRHTGAYVLSEADPPLVAE
jgi:hypothetical protein